MNWEFQVYYFRHGHGYMIEARTKGGRWFNVTSIMPKKAADNMLATQEAELRQLAETIYAQRYGR